MPTVYKNVCKCRLCQGTLVLTCPGCSNLLDDLVCPRCGTTEPGGAYLPDGRLVSQNDLRWTGGRTPDLVVLDPGETFGWVFARGRVEYDNPRANPEDVRLNLPASVHSCFKVRRHQRLLVCGLH